MTFLILIALGIVPHDAAVRDDIDLVEVNHFHDGESGRLVFDQVIFWRYDWERSEYHVIAWRMLKHDGQWPDTRGVCLWHDGDVLRRVKCKIFRESHTFYDPEVDDREHLPGPQRRELTPAKIVIFKE